MRWTPLPRARLLRAVSGVALCATLGACGPGGAAAPSNLLPVADAGPDQVGRVNVLVTLDGSASRDPESGALSFHWEQGRGVPVFVEATPTASVGTIAIDQPGRYESELRVLDGGSFSPPARVAFDVR